MRTIVLLALLSPVVMACSNSFATQQASAEADLTLHNRTGGALLYLALERGSSDLVDPAPSWRVADHLDRLVEPGEARGVEVEGYERGDDVRLFLYRVGDRAGEAPLARVLTVADAQLRGSGYRVVVDEL